MSRSTALILILVAAIFVIGANNVFGVEVTVDTPEIEDSATITKNTTETKDTVLIPFEPLGRVCGWNDAGINWICEWDPNRINLDEAFYANNTAVADPVIASTTVCPDRFYLIDDGITCMPINCEDGFHHDTRFECVADPVPDIPIISLDHQRLVDKLDYYEDNPPKTFTQLNEKWKLEHLSLCWYGINQGRGIQTLDSFVTSTWIEDQDKVYASNVHLIDRAITICTAQTTMLEILGDVRQPGDVRTRQGWWGIVSPTHAEVGVSPGDPIYSQEWVNADANPGIQNSDRHPICEIGSFYSELTKKMYCPEEYAPVNVHGGVINYPNDIEDKWLQYIDDGGAAQEDQIRADILADKRKQLWAHNQVWKLSTVTEQIYEIENAGWSMYPESDSRHCKMTEKVYYEDDKYYTKAIERTLLEYLQKCGE